MAVLVVGAGFSGATVARQVAEAGLEVHVIDKRPHLAGNAYDFVNEHGIRVHKYGPHIFHTSNQEVVDFLSRFTAWVPYRHKVKAMLFDGTLVTFPPNRETIARVGRDRLIEIFYRPYTEKMWGIPLEEVSPDILNRVPIREDQTDFYFPKDAFQALPDKGYTKMIETMLAHPRISVSLGQPFSMSLIGKYDHIFNSMPIDEYFEFSLGTLPYRSIRFVHEHIPCSKIFPVATINLTNTSPYTRLTEWKNFPNHGDNSNWTTLTSEEPCDFAENNFERYYPVKNNQDVNRELYKRYRERVPSKMTFIGRCGLYAYLDMHQAVSTALAIARAFLTKSRPI